MTTIQRRRPKKTAPAEPPTSFGVDPVAAKKALDTFLRRDKGSDKPFCTCGEVRGWGFDCQLGVYVHTDPKCWKPSKGYYEAALRAGLLGELTIR